MVLYDIIILYYKHYKYRIMVHSQRHNNSSIIALFTVGIWNVRPRISLCGVPVYFISRQGTFRGIHVTFRESPEAYLNTKRLKELIYHDDWMLLRNAPCSKHTKHNTNVTTAG